MAMRLSLFGCPSLIPKLPVWTADAPLPPLSSTPRIFGEALPDPDFLPLCSPVVGHYLHSNVFSLAGSSSVGKDRDTVCTQFITQIFTSTVSSVPGLTTTALEHGFLLVGAGKHLLFYSPHVTGRAVPVPIPTARCAPATKCHKLRMCPVTAPWVSHPVSHPHLPQCYTQCSANTVHCGTQLLQPRSYSRRWKQHLDMLISKMPIATPQR